MTIQVLTVGHSTHSLEKFLALLRAHCVTAIADVRSQPFSRVNPDFNRRALAQSLPVAGIAYVFLGRELGARSADPACYIDGRVQYRRLAATPSFRSGLDRVLQGAKSHRIALLCAEREPLSCHRTLLVSRELVTLGVEVAHIHADGTLEAHDDAMSRLLRLLGLPESDLFRSREDLVTDACDTQERKIAYVDEGMRAEAI